MPWKYTEGEISLGALPVYLRAMALEDDVLVGSVTVLEWDEQEDLDDYEKAVDNIEVTVSAITLREPRTVELTFDWAGRPGRSIFDDEGRDLEIPARPLYLHPEQALKLGALLIKAANLSTATPEDEAKPSP
jgi:hypothetical protein